MTPEPKQIVRLDLLRCPYCKGRFTFASVERPALGRGEFGLLRCTCSTFPVVDGIPIIQRTNVGMFEHTQGTSEVDGVPVGQLVKLIETGAAERALLECVSLPPDLAGSIQGLVGWRRARHPAVTALARAVGRWRFVAKVLRSRDAMSASDVLEYYYLKGGPLHPTLGHYFIRRFGQPRHLAALSLAATVPAGSKPVLDIAAGIGHIEHYLTSRSDPVDVVGLDMNFYHLWIARHWMAPSAWFICANASDGLPFVDDAFSATICSDAYHLIGNRKTMLAEVERCAPARMVVLTRVGNSAVMPNEGNERTLDEYLAEFGVASVRAFEEGELVRHYLRRNDPLGEAALPERQLRSSKWFSFAWNVPDTRARSIHSDAVPPHAVGALGYNPIYVQEPRIDGGVRLRFEFPHPWYAYENHGMLAYHPRVVTLSREESRSLTSTGSRELVESLIDSFVVLGLPSRFSRDLISAPPAGRPTDALSG